MEPFTGNDAPRIRLPGLGNADLAEGARPGTGEAGGPVRSYVADCCLQCVTA